MLNCYSHKIFMYACRFIVHLNTSMYNKYSSCCEESFNPFYGSNQSYCEETFTPSEKFKIRTLFFVFCWVKRILGLMANHVVWYQKFKMNYMIPGTLCNVVNSDYWSGFKERAMMLSFWCKICESILHILITLRIITDKYHSMYEILWEIKYCA